MKLLKPIIITILTILILAWAIPTVSYLNWTTLILAGVVLTLLQKIAKPVLKILFLPINIVTLGLFSIVINVALLWLATFLVPGFQIQAMSILGIKLGFIGTLVVISFAISFLQSLIGVFL
ncbi:MAG: phage holin family protein [Candidatus Woesebacteria bacterium]|jgi:putative membrane protein